MPLVTITLLKGRTSEQKRAINEAIHSSLVECFKIPAGDFHHKILELEEENFHIPEGKSRHYLLLEMTIFPGRSLEAKRNLYQTIVNRLEKLDIPPSDVFIVLSEPPLQNWGIRGGHPASEVEIGFKTDV